MKGSYTEKDGVLYDERGNAVFTEEMKKDYTILVPVMCDVHFRLIAELFTSWGYNVELLDDKDTKSVTEVGLRYIHNDTCYPAILVIGELFKAVLSGRYDIHRIALALMETGGGCRASNYQFLLRKALKKAGYGFIPVVPLLFNGGGTQPGFTFKMWQIREMIANLYYGDLITTLRNQCLPTEVNKGDADALTDEWVRRLTEENRGRRKIDTRVMEVRYREIIKTFEDIPRVDTGKPKVGIVGECYVKYAPLGNNDLERYLIAHDAEAVSPGLTNFIMYCAYDSVTAAEMYGMHRMSARITRMFIRSLCKREKAVKKALDESNFRSITTFDEMLDFSEGILSRGMVMGEGWFLAAEIVELIREGVNNVIIVQPFGCLPNHVAGRGIMRKMREMYPGVNIISVDYDGSASRINQENRIRLLLSNARNGTTCPDPGDEIPLL